MFDLPFLQNDGMERIVFKQGKVLWFFSLKYKYYLNPSDKK